MGVGVAIGEEIGDGPPYLAPGHGHPVGIAAEMMIGAADDQKARGHSGFDNLAVEPLCLVRGQDLFVVIALDDEKRGIVAADIHEGAEQFILTPAAADGRDGLVHSPL